MNIGDETEHFGDRLAKACTDKQSAVCVGLDPRWSSLPNAIRGDIGQADVERVCQATETFCCEVIDAVCKVAPVVKPQAAFFECLGPSGTRALARVIQYARRSGVLVLLDGKRGDIGSTAEGYAAAYLGAGSPWGCDALTVNPYLGDDTLAPFVQACEASGGGIFVLVKTSNPGSGFLQDLDVAGRRVYERVAECVAECGNHLVGKSGFSSVGAVVGATYPEQLAELRAAMPHAWILIPGYGAQGGTADNVRYGFKDGSGAIVNSSRGIIFAFQNPEYQHLNWQEAVYRAASDMREQLAS